VAGGPICWPIKSVMIVGMSLMLLQCIPNCSKMCCEQGEAGLMFL